MNPIKTPSIVRVIASQISTSRNTGDGVIKSALRAFWVVVLLTRSCWRGLANLNTQTIGDRVIHNGEVWSISNWAGSAFVHLCGVSVKGYKENVSQLEFVAVRSISTLWHRYSFHRDFYRFSWLAIDVNKRLYPEAFTGEPYNV